MVVRRKAGLVRKNSKCSGCGEIANLEVFQKRWLCSKCLTVEEKPRNIEDYCYSNSNFARAQEQSSEYLSSDDGVLDYIE